MQRRQLIKIINSSAYKIILKYVQTSICIGKNIAKKKKTVEKLKNV